VRVKKKKKDNRTEERATNKKDVAAPEPPATDTDKPLDYGGLPDRDLKKNMGCGS
jgi:hypothetical protein